jgi:hypothetical protein
MSIPIGGLAKLGKIEVIGLVCQQGIGEILAFLKIVNAILYADRFRKHDRAIRM